MFFLLFLVSILKLRIRLLDVLDIFPHSVHIGGATRIVPPLQTGIENIAPDNVVR